MSSIHALVVEDDLLIVEDVQERLASLGHSCDCVECQDEARARLESTEHSYSYILLDLGLPISFGRKPRVENGLNLLKDISEAPKFQNVPVIVMTAHGKDGPDLAVEVLRYGRAMDFIKKPFSSNNESFETKVLKTLERVGLHPGGQSARGSTSRLRHKQPSASAGPYSGLSDLQWEEVAITPRDGHTVSVKIRGESQIFTFAQLGLADGRNCNPTVQWELLLAFAKSCGVLDWTSKSAGRRNQKRREKLGRNLREFFGVDDDPFIVLPDKKGWRARFSISPE